MLKAERLELAKVVRLRVKVAKNEVDKRVTRVLADVEAQLAAQYPSNHAAWKEITKQAEDYIAQADKDIAERCRALGIPGEFRPGLNLAWYRRGENAVSSRRAELRKVAQTELAARAVDAKAEVDRQAVIQLTRLPQLNLDFHKDQIF
jgi:hypothetical protein